MKSTISILVLPVLATIVLALPLHNFEDPDALLNDMRFRDGDLHTVTPNLSLRWPKGVVVFKIDPAFSAAEKKDIQKGFGLISSATCVKFREATSKDVDYAFIKRGSGCNSYVGKIGGEQIVNLESNGFCTTPGVVAHEMLHAIGFYHEMQRPDRDDNVIVLWENIQKMYLHNFDMKSSLLTYGTSYDYMSIMHYGPYSGSANGKPVMLNNRIFKVTRMRARKLITVLGLILALSWAEGAVAKNKTSTFAKKKLQVSRDSIPEPTHYSLDLVGSGQKQQQQQQQQQKQQQKQQHQQQHQSLQHPQQNHMQDFSAPSNGYMVSYDIPGMTNHVSAVGTNGETMSETSYAVVSENVGYGAPMTVSTDYGPKIPYGGPGIKDTYASSSSIKNTFGPTYSDVAYGSSLKESYGPSLKDTFGPAPKDSFGPTLKDTFGPTLKDPFGPSFKDTFGPTLKESYGPSFKDPFGPPIIESYGPPKTNYGPPKTKAPFWQGSGFKTPKGPHGGQPSQKHKFNIPIPELNHLPSLYGDSEHEGSNIKGNGMAGLGSLAGSLGGLKGLIPVLALVPILASIALVFLPLPWLYFPPGVLDPTNGVIKLGRGHGRNGLAWDFNSEKFLKFLGQAEKLASKAFEKLVAEGREFSNGKNECLERLSCELFKLARAYNADKLLDAALRQIFPLSNEKSGNSSRKGDAPGGCLAFSCKPLFKGKD
ncbi:unnamed protein product [Allacma fusca]|uniref:Peptidase M12A domain-containing protein n=1 Tax=Allacma fusca TaxID=39272 RepID=A0A8J2JWX0_9HEXA|nr:unnamed protein product [Allacma fusca]